MDKQPTFSVILPVCHGGRFLESALSSLKKVIPPANGFEVIVSGAHHAAAEIFSRFAGPGWLFVESQGNRSDALNAACLAARGAIWVFSDDDCVFPSEWLLKIDTFFICHREAAAMGGSDVLARYASDFDFALDAVLNSWFSTGGTRSDRSFKAGAYYPKLWNMAVRADTARQIALDGQSGRLIFDPGLPVHEDVDLMERIRHAKKGTILYAPEIVVEHSRDTTYTEFFKRNIAMARMCRKQRVHLLAHLVVAGSFVIFIALNVLLMWYPAARCFFGLAVFGYTTVLFFVSALGIFRIKRPALIFWIPVLLASLHAARAIGFIWPDVFIERKT